MASFRGIDAGRGKIYSPFLYYAVTGISLQNTQIDSNLYNFQLDSDPLSGWMFTYSFVIT